MSEKAGSLNKQNTVMTFREAKGHLMYAFSESLINDKDFALLYDLNTWKYQDFHYWEYDSFDLDANSEHDAYAEMMLMQSLDF